MVSLCVGEKKSRLGKEATERVIRYMRWGLHCVIYTPGELEHIGGTVSIGMLGYLHALMHCLDAFFP